VKDARRLLREGRRAEALAAARAAYDPHDQESRLVLGLVCAAAGAAREAVTHLEAVLAPGQGQPQHWRVLAAARSQLGDSQGEADALTEAVALAPGDRALRLYHARALLDADRREEALAASIQALKLGEDIEARRLFVDALAGARRTDEEFRAWLKRALSEGWGRPGKLFHPTLNVIRAGARGLDRDELLPELLASGPVVDADLERELTEHRRAILLSGQDEAGLAPALGAQCHINEFCWRVTPEEAEALAARGPGDPVRRLYSEQHVTAVDEDIPALTPIHDRVSQTVRAMYEENPYPRWVRLPEQQPRPLDWVIRNTFPLAPVDRIEGSNILVAGCGTGRHAIQFAKRYEGAQVLAVDLSRASLTYARRKAAELGVQNVTFAQADLLELGALDMRFDAISCAGTLQAMADPYQGLAVLLALLKPGGVIHLGLYSRKARREIAPAQRLASTFPATRDGIRVLRRRVMDAPPQDPVRAVLDWPDFYSTSMCRDLLMHVQEHQHDIGDVRAMTEGAGLRFLGFVQEPGVMQAYRRAFPDDPAGLNLAHWDTFESGNPSIFRGMYQVWAQRPAS
jgi:SAM-dependent methyltransferase